VNYRPGLVERYGSGIERFITPLRSAGMLAPDFSSTPFGFTLTMREDLLTGSVLREMGLNERQVLAVNHLKTQGSITNSGYRSLTGVAATTALKEFKALVDLGILERRAPSRKKDAVRPARGTAMMPDVDSITEFRQNGRPPVMERCGCPAGCG